MEERMNEQTSLTQRETAVALSPFQKELARRKRVTRVVMVLDISSSMASPGDEPNTRRIDQLRSIVNNLHSQGLNFQQLCFADDPIWSDVIPEPYGSTNMTDALRKCAQAQPEHVVIVSDGEPNDMASARDAALALNCRIDAYLVGDTGRRMAKEFMDSIAKSTGGQSGAVSFKELEARIAGALTAGSPAAEAEGKAIAL